MSGYLDEYGASEARREAIIKRIALVALLLVTVAGLLYFQFRNFREEAKFEAFMEALEENRYANAYALWGCTEQQPCPGYSFEKFMEDWGPESGHSNIAEAEITRTRSCPDGIIKVLSFGEEEEVPLFIDRTQREISFSPWKMCNPRYVPPPQPQ